MAAVETTPELRLSDLLAAGPLAPRRAHRYATAIALELRRLHSAGVLAGEGLDTARIRLTGDRAYLDASPSERVDDRRDTRARAPADMRGDIYAFGAVLYHMLAGGDPAEDTKPAHLRAALMQYEEMAGHREQTGSSNRMLHAGLARIAHGCLAASPDRRWQRMQCVVNELKLLGISARQAALDGDPHGEQLSDLAPKIRDSHAAQPAPAANEREGSPADFVAPPEQKLAVEIRATKTAEPERLATGEIDAQDRAEPQAVRAVQQHAHGTARAANPSEQDSASPAKCSTRAHVCPRCESTNVDRTWPGDPAAAAVVSSDSRVSDVSR